jgi:hypothetical protein
VYAGMAKSGMSDTAFSGLHEVEIMPKHVFSGMPECAYSDVSEADFFNLFAISEEVLSAASSPFSMA